MIADANAAGGAWGKLRSPQVLEFESPAFKIEVIKKSSYFERTSFNANSEEMLLHLLTLAAKSLYLAH